MSEAALGPAIFCMASYEKGQAFLREAHRLGCRVMLLTVDELREGDWPWESIDEFFTMPRGLAPAQVQNTVTYLARTRRIDRVVSLDEFDLMNAALLREHMRLPGMGQTATRFFRDKLAMRVRAREAGIPVPEFCRVLNHAEIAAFLESTPGPWLLKPRMNASAIGIRLIERAEELWPVLEGMGDLQSEYLLERFVPGEVFHVDGITWEGEILFAAAHQYGQPPMQTMHQGGVFTTRSLEPERAETRALLELHARVVKALGMVSGVTHTEFIRVEDGRFSFLESAARVGGAFIAEVVEAEAGVNPWVEWARIEVAMARGEQYRLPELRREFAGSVLCLARQEEPDTSGYTDPQIVHRIRKHHHAGLIVQSDSAERVRELVEEYAARFLEDFCATAPVPERAP